MEFGVKNAPKPRILEKDVKVLRKMKMIGFCSEPMIMFDFYRWNGVLIILLLRDSYCFPGLVSLQTIQTLN